MVHLSSGSAALIAAFFTDYVLKKEKDEKNKKTETPRTLEKRKTITKHGRQIQEIENLETGGADPKESTAFIVLGTGILWFGWFGFNAGSALAASSQSVLALINTNISAASALLTWYILEALSGKKPSVIGMCIGAVCGLVGITPACGFVPIYSSGIIGVLSSIGTFLFYMSLEKCSYKPDDRLGVFGCHGISGIIGSIAVGFFADKEIGAFTDGIFQNGGGYLLGVQLAGICCSFIWSAVITFILLFIMYKLNLYKVIDENEKEVNDFDEQAVFIPDFEKILAKKGFVRPNDLELYKLKSNAEKVESCGVLDEKRDIPQTNLEVNLGNEINLVSKQEMF